MKTIKRFFTPHRILILLLVIGTVIRVIPTFIFYGTGDVQTSHAVGVELLSGGNVYDNKAGSYYNYYPDLLYSIIGLGVYLERTFHIPYYFIFKLPSALSDVVIIYLIYVISFKLSKNKRQALIGAALYTFNPVSIIISGFHGQLDSLVNLCVLLTAYYFYFYVKQKNTIQVVLLSVLGITLKPWAGAIVPLIAIRLKTLGESIKYVGSVSILLGVITAICVFLYGSIFIAKVYFYYPPPDYGIGAVFEHFPAIFTKAPFNFVKEVFFANRFLIPKIILAMFLFLGFIKTRKRNIFEALTLTFVIIYACSAGLASQYFTWVIPYAIISRDKMVVPYSLLASLAIITFYLDRNLSAFQPMVLQQYFVAGEIFLTYGKMIIILWIFTLFWMMRKFRKI